MTINHPSLLPYFPDGGRKAVAKALRALRDAGHSVDTVDNVYRKLETRRQSRCGVDGAVSDPHAGAALRARLARRLLTLALGEIRRRGGETSIAGRYGSEDLRIVDRQPSRRLALLHCSGWREYSRRFGCRRAALSYLFGHDDSGYWAARVPGTLQTVDDALDWIIPADVRAAMDVDVDVRRQGDVWLLPARTDNLRALRGTRHEARPHGQGGYTLIHPEHRPVRLPGRCGWRAIVAKQLPMGRIVQRRRDGWRGD